MNENLFLSLLFLLFILFIMIVTDGDIIDDAKILKNTVWDGYEKNAGAHYYAYSPYKTEYSKVEGNIKLPDSLNTNNGKRNAYISFGVLGLYGAINTGIMNSGKGWLPFYYDNKSQKIVTFKDNYAPEGTKLVNIEVKVTSLRIINFSLKYMNRNLITLKTFKTEIDASHLLVYENDEVKLRFFRFVSMPPIEKDDQNDGTFMIGGEFNELKITKNEINELWGIQGDNIDVSWLVSSKRIEVNIQDDQESFSIEHKKKNK